MSHFSRPGCSRRLLLARVAVLEARERPRRRKQRRRQTREAAVPAAWPMAIHGACSRNGPSTCRSTLTARAWAYEVLGWPWQHDAVVHGRDGDPFSVRFLHGLVARLDRVRQIPPVDGESYQESHALPRDPERTAGSGRRSAASPARLTVAPQLAAALGYSQESACASLPAAGGSLSASLDHARDDRTTIGAVDPVIRGVFTIFVPFSVICICTVTNRS